MVRQAHHERAAELDYLVEVLRPPCSLGPYTLTGYLARSETAVLFTARGEGLRNEGVLKITGAGYAPILERELALLQLAAATGLDGIVRPLHPELLWLPVGGEDADRPAAAMVLPFL